MVQESSVTSRKKPSAPRTISDDDSDINDSFNVGFNLGPIVGMKRAVAFSSLEPKAMSKRWDGFGGHQSVLFNGDVKKKSTISAKKRPVTKAVESKPKTVKWFGDVSIIDLSD